MNRRGAADGSTCLTAYLRDVAAAGLMTAEQELAASVRIVELREAYWRSLLGPLPLVDAICAVASEALAADSRCAGALATTRRAARRLRRGDPRASLTALDAARGRLAVALAEVDLDGVLADRVRGDIELLADGRDAKTGLGGKLPLCEHAALRTHMASVRAAHHALWRAKGAFVVANLRLVVTIVRRFHHCPMPLADMIQEGNLGLMKAVNRFDPHKGFRFSSYASWWIRQAIGRSIAEKARAVRHPVHAVVAHNKVRRVTSVFEVRHGRKPDDAEIALLTGVNTGLLKRYSFEDPVSTAQPLSGTDLTVLDTLADPLAPEAAEAIDRRLLVSSLRESFAALTPIEADILRKRTGIDDDRVLTLREIGEGYALSRERIRQVQEQALQKLREEFERRQLM